MMMKIGFAFVLLALAFSSGHPAGKTWPSGQYCLPMPDNQRCPSGWHKGYRFHDAEDRNNANRKHGHVPYLSKFGKDIEWGFCCKTNDPHMQSHVHWPRGQYCIFRKGGHCPWGFREGWTYWDDEDRNNHNRFSGTLPDGRYNENTHMYFCCRDEPQVPKNLSLPTCGRLVLMRYKHACPSITDYHGPYTGYLQWDTEDSENADERDGAYPDSGRISTTTGIKIEFCTYKSFYSC